MALSLNEEYSLSCKGWTHNPDAHEPFANPDGQRYLRVPDYLADDGELGRMVKALTGGPLESQVSFHFDDEYETPDFTGNGDHGPYFCGVIAKRKKVGDEFYLWEEFWSGASNNEAAARACIALHLQVPNA